MALTYLTLALVFCACSKDDAKLWRIGFPYSESVWVDYLFDEARPDDPVVILNPYSDGIVGRRVGGIRNGVISSDWTTELNGERHGWQVKLRADSPVFEIAGRTGSLDYGRLLVLTDSKAQEFPIQIDIPLPAGLRSEEEIRKWLDGIRMVGLHSLANTRTSAGAGQLSEHATAVDSHALLIAERAMMSKVLASVMHNITGITDNPRDTIAYHGLHSYQPAKSYADRAFIPWNGSQGYVVFEVKPGLGPFRYYGIAVGENGKAGGMGAARIIPAD